MAATPSRVSPLRKMPTIRVPTSVPRTLPRPPNRLVPPTTTAVMLSRLAHCPACGSPDPRPPPTHQHRGGERGGGPGGGAEGEKAAPRPQPGEPRGVRVVPGCVDMATTD